MRHGSDTKMRGSLALLLGVVLVLTFTAGAAAAEESDPGSSQVGDALLIQRPAPPRDPSTELRAPAPASATPGLNAPAPLAAPAVADATPAMAATVPATPAGAATQATPARPTQVLGVQIHRSAVARRAGLARTGANTSVLVLIAGILLGVGAVLIQISQALRYR